VDAKRISGEQDTNFGIIFRYQDASNYYSYLISSDGYYALIKVSGGQELLLGMEQFVYSDLISQADGQNEITITCKGEQLSLMVNGKMLHSVRDDSFSAGDVGFIVETREAGAASVLFTNFLVTKQ
jgi:hypothetical protein